MVPRTPQDGPDRAAPAHRGTFEGRDGAELAYARFDVGSGRSRVLVFLHGIGSHGAMYYHMASALGQAVDSVYFPDLRGHGVTRGPRGDLVSPLHVLGDIGAVVSAVRAEHPTDEIVLGGESMGGLFALAYGARRPNTIDALVLAAPALMLNTRRLHSPDALRRGWDGLFGDQVGPPGIPVTGALEGDDERCPGFADMCLRDPLALQSVSLKYLLIVGAILWNWEARYPRRLVRAIARGRGSGAHLAAVSTGLPVLIVQGGADAVMDPRGARRLHRLLPQAEFVEFPEAWHNLFWDPRSADVLTCMSDWMAGGGRRQREGP